MLGNSTWPISEKLCTYESMIRRLRYVSTSWKVHTLAFAGNGTAMASGSEAADVDGCQRCEDLRSIGFDRIILYIYVVHSASSDSVIIHIVLVSK